MLSTLNAILFAAFSAWGLWLVWSALMRMRSGRLDRVCPLCGYDLAKVPGRRCIECGFDAGHVDDLYPGGQGWKRLATGMLVLTPGIALGWTLMWADADGKELLQSWRWVWRCAGLLTAGAGLVLIVRTLLRDLALQRRALPHKRGRGARFVVGLLIIAHGSLLALSPRGVQNGWKSLPPAPIKQAGRWVIDHLTKP
ncbi:MAG: hypothetical protein ACKVS8_02890 [Phycisphaerales bacterium]